MNPEMRGDLRQLIESRWEGFRARVDSYAKWILEGGTYKAGSPYEVARIYEIATGWAVVIILAGTLWGVQGPLRRLDQYWTRDEQADAVENMAFGYEVWYAFKAGGQATRGPVRERNLPTAIRRDSGL